VERDFEGGTPEAEARSLGISREWTPRGDTMEGQRGTARALRSSDRGRTRREGRGFDQGERHGSEVEQKCRGFANERSFGTGGSGQRAKDPEDGPATVNIEGGAGKTDDPLRELHG